MRTIAVVLSAIAFAVPAWADAPATSDQPPVDATKTDPTVTTPTDATTVPPTGTTDAGTPTDTQDVPPVAAQGEPAPTTPGTGGSARMAGRADLARLSRPAIIPSISGRA